MHALYLSYSYHSPPPHSSWTLSTRLLPNFMLFLLFSNPLSSVGATQMHMGVVSCQHLKKFTFNFSLCVCLHVRECSVGGPSVCVVFIG